MNDHVQNPIKKQTNITFNIKSTNWSKQFFWNRSICSKLKTKFLRKNRFLFLEPKNIYRSPFDFNLFKKHRWNSVLLFRENSFFFFIWFSGFSNQDTFFISLLMCFTLFPTHLNRNAKKCEIFHRNSSKIESQFICQFPNSSNGVTLNHTNSSAYSKNCLEINIQNDKIKWSNKWIIDNQTGKRSESFDRIIKLL